MARIAAAIIVALGVLFLASAASCRARAGMARPQRLLARAGRGGPVVAGAAFAVAWTPCMGPTLTAILARGDTHSEAQGALLLAFYSAGLAIPFLATSLAFGRMTRLFALVKRHYAVSWSQSAGRS